MKCPGKIVMESGKIKNVHHHSHEKEAKISIVDKFRKVLTKKAVEKLTKPLVEIYLEETLNFTEASILYPFQSAESTMRKARAKHRPRVDKPSGAGAGEEKRISSHQHQLRKHYFQETLLDYGTTVLLMHQYSLKMLGKIEEIHVDCSVSCRSDDNTTDLYLITVLAMQGHQDYPIAFGLVAEKSIEVFASFFSYIRDKASSALTPNNILTSCNENLQEALRASFPDATIKIMWFFYASSVLKFAKQNGMLAMMNRNLFHLSSLKMMLAIPLIPSNYMVPALDSLKKWMSEKSVCSFDGLCEFIDATWLVSDGAEKISIFNGLSHSINNYIQIFNRDLLHAVNGEPLMKEKLLEAISKQATKTVAKLNKAKGSVSLKKAQKLQKTILETATHNWIKANIHLRRPIQFLQQVPHCIDDGMINFLINSDVDKKSHEAHIVSSFSNYAPTSEPPPLIFFQKQPATYLRRPVISNEPPPLVPY